VLFDFDVDPGAVARYYDAAVTVEPRKLFDALKKAKVLIHKATKNQARALPALSAARR